MTFNKIFYHLHCIMALADIVGTTNKLSVE
jgi:hypothetical protein